MSFMVRPAQQSDLESLYELSTQFVLLNLPSNRAVLEKKISTSLSSFAGEVKKDDGAEYLFVLEDVLKSKIVGCSLILAKHGTEKIPHYCFKLVKHERHSQDLGIGFIHHVLRLSEETDGPTEIGGLLLDSEYRNKPYKLGRLISLCRFMYMGQNTDRFQKNVLCEFAPLLGEGGRSHLWEELGRKFTGLTYSEADRLSIKNKEFIKQLFPIEDIYLALLSPEVRMNLGKVSEETEPAKYLLEKVGFKYLQEIDPFDGGPHFGALASEISIVKDMEETSFIFSDEKNELPFQMVSISGGNDFVACMGKKNNGKIAIPTVLKARIEKMKDVKCYTVNL